MTVGGGPFRIDAFTLFPPVLRAYWSESILGRASRQGRCGSTAHDLRDHTTDRHRTVDDTPFGGGAGMVMMPAPLFDAVAAVDPPRPLLLLSPAGRRFDQAWAHELADGPGFSLLCGRYEGVDERVAEHLADAELSIGDVVLTGGEAAALVVIEAVVRLLPGVLGNDRSVAEESFTEGLLEHPQYTRPADFRGWQVPEVLRSGDHGRVRRWREAQALARTVSRRPDLIASRGGLDDADRALLDEFGLAAKTLEGDPEG